MIQSTAAAVVVVVVVDPDAPILSSAILCSLCVQRIDSERRYDCFVLLFLVLTAAAAVSRCSVQWRPDLRSLPLQITAAVHFPSFLLLLLQLGTTKTTTQVSEAFPNHQTHAHTPCLRRRCCCGSSSFCFCLNGHKYQRRQQQQQ